MFQTIRNAFKIPDLRRRIFFTIMMLIVFRFGAHIPVPYLNPEFMKEFLSGGGMDLFSLFDIFTGGAFSNATVMALGVSPYINASIIVQLLTVAIPALERLAKEGAEGRKKINKITRYLGIALAFVQGAGLYVTLHNIGVESGLTTIQNEGVLTFFIITLTFTAGTAFIVWLGEIITEKGLGNGVSMIIFAGIVSRIPSGALAIYNQFLATGFNIKGVIICLLILVIAILAITLVVLFNSAERRITVQYAKRVVGRKMYGGQSTNIPIKVAMAGVIPIIFAMSIMSFPGTLAQLFGKPDGVLVSITNFLTTGAIYPILYFLLIVGFTYFYTSITFNPIEVSNNLKTNNGAIPGIRPGRPTTEYISKVLSRLTLIGALCLGVIAVLPIVITMVMKTVDISRLSLTGTSLLIVVGVALETVREVESQMLMRHYKGFLE